MQIDPDGTIWLNYSEQQKAERHLMNKANGVDSLNNKLPLTEEQVKLLEKQKAEGTAQEEKKDDETVPF